MENMETMSKVFTRTQFIKAREERLERARNLANEQLRLIEEKLVPLFEKNRDSIIEAINDVLEMLVSGNETIILPREIADGSVINAYGYEVVLRMYVPGSTGIIGYDSEVKKMIFEKALTPILEPYVDDDGWQVSYDEREIRSITKETDILYLSDDSWMISLAGQRYIDMNLHFL